MKKFTIIVILLASILACNKQEDFSKNGAKSLHENCFNIKFSTDVKINLDCPEKSLYLVNITQCEEFRIPEFCHFTAALYFGDQLVKTTLLEGSPVTGFFQGYFEASKFDLHRFLYTPVQERFGIKIFKHCNRGIFSGSKELLVSEFKDIQIIKSGQNYTKLENLYGLSYDVICLEDELLKNNGVWILDTNRCFEFQNLKIKVIQKDNGKYTITTDLPNYFNFEFDLPKTYKIDLNQLSFDEKIKICGEKGKLVYLALHIDYRTYCEYTYKSTCSDDIFVSEKMFKIPIRISRSTCVKDYKVENAKIQ